MDAAELNLLASNVLSRSSENPLAEDRAAHRRINSFVRKKFRTSTDSDANTTARVAEVPTPTVPPRVRSPSWHAMRPIARPKKTVLVSPEKTSDGRTLRTMV